MACTATIQSIQLSPDGTGNGVNYLVCVLFNDITSGYTQGKNYSFAGNSSILADKAVIQADLNTIKSAIASASALQTFVGTVLT